MEVRTKKKFKRSEPSPQNTLKNTLYVGNLRFDKDVRGIKQLFSHYGRVKWVKLVMDFKAGRSKGIAFVEMETAQEASKAIQNLNGKIVENRTLKVSVAIPKPKKSATEKLETSRSSLEKTVKEKKKSGLEALLSYKSKSSKPKKSVKFVKAIKPIRPSK